MGYGTGRRVGAALLFNPVKHLFRMGWVGVRTNDPTHFLTTNDRDSTSIRSGTVCFILLVAGSSLRNHFEPASRVRQMLRNQ